MFIFALIANVTYVGSILVRTTEWDKTKANMPWLLDAVVSTSPTQSIGLLSYTFLRSTGKEDIVVPMLDYEKDENAWKNLNRLSQFDWNRNVETFVDWSPFFSEDDLLQEFNSMKEKGTRLIIYNLWEDDQGELELDFCADSHLAAHLETLGRAATELQIKKPTHIGMDLLFEWDQVAAFVRQPDDSLFSWCERFQCFHYLIYGIVVELDFLYPSEGIYKCWGNGYQITSTAATWDQAALILSVPKCKLGDETQETLRTSAFPSIHVKIFKVIQKEDWYMPDVFLYKDLIIALAKCKKMEEAMQVWESMRKEDLFPDSQTYAEVLRGFLKYGSPAVAMEHL